MTLPDREQSKELLAQYVKNDALRHHCYMVATAMEVYARELGEDEELWYQTGLLHDLDWEMYPDEHPHKAVNELLTDYPDVMLRAILSHGPDRTGIEPESVMERHLFACDELAGFMHAYALMRPHGFEGMKASKVRKKLKDASFAASVSREDIEKGFELLDVEPSEHIAFLVQIFGNMKQD